MSILENGEYALIMNATELEDIQAALRLAAALSELALSAPLPHGLEDVATAMQTVLDAPEDAEGTLATF